MAKNAKTESAAKRQKLSPLSRARVTMLPALSAARGGYKAESGATRPLAAWETTQKGTLVLARHLGVSQRYDSDKAVHVFRADRDIPAGTEILALCPILGTGDSTLEGVLGGMQEFGRLSAADRAELEAEKARREAAAAVKKLAGLGHSAADIQAMIAAATAAQK